MASKTSPMTIYFKCRGSHVLPFLREKVVKMPKNEVLACRWNQLHYLWSKLYRFVPLVWMAIRSHLTQALWPFTTKVGAAMFHHFREKLVKMPKNEVLARQWKPIALPMDKIVQICSSSMYGNTMALNTSPMTIYFKSRGRHVSPFLRRKLVK